MNQIIMLNIRKTNCDQNSEKRRKNNTSKKVETIKPLKLHKKQPKNLQKKKLK